MEQTTFMRFKFEAPGPLLALVCGCGDTADLVVRNAHIVAMDGRGTTAQAMAVKDGWVWRLAKSKRCSTPTVALVWWTSWGRRCIQGHRRAQPPARVRPGFGPFECGGNHLLRGGGERCGEGESFSVGLDPRPRLGPKRLGNRTSTANPGQLAPQHPGGLATDRRPRRAGQPCGAGGFVDVGCR